MDTLWTLTYLIYFLKFKATDTFSVDTFSVSVSPADRITISENADSSQDLFTVVCTYYSTSEVSCSSCSISNYPDSDVFYMSGMTVKKYACGTTSCGNYPTSTACSNSPGCLTAGTYSISIRCSYGSNTSVDYVLTVEATAESPTLTINLPATTNASNSMSQSHTIFTVDKNDGPAIVKRVKDVSVLNSYLLNTVNLFELDTGNGNVYINANPSLEYDYTYTMRGLCSYVTSSMPEAAEMGVCVGYDGRHNSESDGSRVIPPIGQPSSAMDF